MDLNSPNTTQTPVEGTATPASAASETVQNQDKSDAMTYPLGSQSAAPIASQQMSEEDHRSILERITGIFSKHKKEQMQEAEPIITDQIPTNTTPAPGE